MWLGEAGRGEAAEEPWVGEAAEDDGEEPLREASDQVLTSCWRPLSRAENTSPSSNSL